MLLSASTDILHFKGVVQEEEQLQNIFFLAIWSEKIPVSTVVYVVLNSPLQSPEYIFLCLPSHPKEL